MTFLRLFTSILFVLTVAIASPALAQEHGATPSAQKPVSAAQGAQPAKTAEGHEDTSDEHGNDVWSMVFRLGNFAVLVGVLVYFGKPTVVGYLVSRSAQIRQDLVTASEMRAAASAQLAQIEARMATLPGELDALRHQGAADVQSEQARIGEAAALERDRLLSQTRREIDMRLRIAKRELTEHAAALAVQVAEQRIKRVITPEDQVRLIDRYSSQLREAR